MQVRNAILGLFAILLSASVSYAQPSHPNSPHDTVKAKDITITYGRPYKKEGDLRRHGSSYGKTYRCGADEPTIVTFSKDVTFGGKSVKAGKYSFFAVPKKDKWTVILNSNTSMWGTDHDKHADQDVVKVDVPVMNLSKPVEQLTMAVKGGKVTLAWDTVEIGVPVTM